MKTKIFTIALITVTSITSQLFAQETAILKTRTKSNQSNERSSANGTHIKSAILVCRATPSEGGCVVTLENKIVSPRDAASGLPTGKRMHKPMSVFVSSSDNSVSEVKSPRDAASGLATGRRMHKPTVLTQELGKSEPSSSPSTSEIAIDEPGVHKTGGGGAGKASFSDLSVTSAGKATFKEFTVTKRCDGKTTEIRCPNGDCEIPLDDCPNGTCDLVCSWSWGVSNSGSMASGSGAGSGRCAAGFSLEIEDGACTAMAINEKGLPGEKKPKKTTTNNPK